MADDQAVLTKVGRNIRKARLASGLNLHQLAFLSGISAPALSRIETSKRDLRITSLFRIAAALRVNSRSLVEPAKDEAPGVARRRWRESCRLVQANARAASAA